MISPSSTSNSGGSEEEERSLSQEEARSPPILVPQGAAAENVGSAVSSADAAAGISCLELDAWIRDDDGAMDSMMLLPEMPMEGDSTSPEDSSMHQDCCEQFEHKAQDDEMIFCRSSSSCSSTFPDSCDNQETLELSLPDDFFGERQAQQQPEQILPPLAEARSAAHFLPDLKKIIVKKPVMDKAVERLGGGRRGAMRLWNIIQVWLKHQQQGGTGLIDGLTLPLENFGGFVNTPMIHQQLEQQQPPIFPGTGYGDALSSHVYFGDPGIAANQFGTDVTTTCVTADASRSVVPPISPSSSAAATTRAARKSRMARQRRHRGIVGSMQSNSLASTAGAWSPPSTAAFLAPTAATTTTSSPLSLPTTQAAPGAREQPIHNFGSCRDGVKAPARMSCEKSVKFLLQKELKPSDVGNLGRIVLPKKEAELHLPYLSLREGITLAMEDALTAQTWHFRYRFWPNNKSRMYLLEGTGEYVRSHLLKEGDLLQIYRDCKTGKHIIASKKTVKAKSATAETGTSTNTLEDECSSGASTVSDSSKDAPVDQKQRCKGNKRSRNGAMKKSSSAIAAIAEPKEEIERFPSVDMGDEFIEEILGMVDAEEPSSPESCKEDD